MLDINMKKLLGVLIGLLAHAVTAQVARAEQVPDAPYVYLGIGAAGTERAAGGTRLHPKVSGGYAFSDTLAIEGGVIDLRKATPAPQARTIDLGGFGTYFAARFTRPLMDRLSAYGKLGVAHSQRKTSLDGLLRKETDTGAYGAFGLQYAVTQKLAVNAEYERFGKDKKHGAKADAWTLGLKFEF
jgi:hypothetical protein